MRNVRIFTDGSCWPNPGGPGGWACIIQYHDLSFEHSGHIPAPSTNNRAELTAAIEGLKSLTEPASVTVITDSQYLQRGAQEYMFWWHRRDWASKVGWKRGVPKAERKLIPNADLWQEIWRLCGVHNVMWQWVRGHAVTPENIRCDFLAEQQRTRRRNSSKQ